MAYQRSGRVSMMGADNLRKVIGYGFHHLRRAWKRSGEACQYQRRSQPLEEGGTVARAKRNGADGAWEASGIVEGEEGEAAGVTGDWAGKGGEVEEDAESSVWILFLPPPLIWSSLSHLYIFSIRHYFLLSIPFFTLFSLSPRIPLSPCYAFSSL